MMILNQIVEDKLHFLFNCRLYTQERQEFTDFSKQLNKSFPYLTDIDKWRFITLSNNKQLIYLICKFSSVAFEKRRAHVHSLLSSLFPNSSIFYIPSRTIGPPGLHLSLKLIVIVNGNVGTFYPAIASCR